MKTYSVAEARNNLSALIDRARQGEGVVITRHGMPVAEIRAIPTHAGPITEADLNWLAANRLQPRRPPADGTGQLMSGIRDEDAH